MSSDHSASVDDWQRYKFTKQMEVEERKLAVEGARLRSENIRNVLIGALIPIVLAIVTALPAYLASRGEIALQKASFEANLILESVRTGDPDQAAENLAFLIRSGLISGATADRVRSYLETRTPGRGRALPAR